MSNGYSIRTLRTEDVDDVIWLFKDSFKNDHVYRDLGIDTMSDMPQDFILAINYAINTGASLGYYIDDKLVGFLIGFDYNNSINNDTEEYRRVFGITDNSSIYGSELSKLFDEAKEHSNLYYIMSIAVYEPLRRQGIATRLVDYLITHTNYDIIGDVSSMISIPIYQRQGFNISTIGDEYKLVVLSRH